MVNLDELIQAAIVMRLASSDIAALERVLSAIKEEIERLKEEVAVVKVTKYVFDPAKVKFNVYDTVVTASDIVAVDKYDTIINAPMTIEIVERGESA